MPIVSSSAWDAFYENHPDSHILQSSLWGELKSNFGWNPYHLISETINRAVKYQIGAQILIRPFFARWSVAYIPKGPIGGNGIDFLGDHGSKFWTEIDQFCQKNRIAFLIIEPDSNINEGVFDNNAGLNYIPVGFQRGILNIQPNQTIIIKINRSDEEILGAMKQKTRYNIRLAHRKEVSVTPQDDINAFHSLMVLTGERDGFGIHNKRYYKLAYELFHPSSKCELFFAEYKNELIGAIMVFANGNRAWYMYGASSVEHRQSMPNYLLQWRAIQWARDLGCEYYDLWGIPDENIETLEKEFTKRSDGLWGVYRFKRGFGGCLQRSFGPWDRVYSPVLYKLFRYYINLKKFSLS